MPICTLCSFPLAKRSRPAHNLCMTRTILEISGADRVSFLQGLVSNDVARLDAGGLVYAALLSPQGKYLADFFLVPLGDKIGVDVDSAQAANLARRLSMYKLRADVAIAQSELQVGRGLGDMPEGAFADPRDPALGWRRYAMDASDDASIDWEALSVAHLVPQSGTDLVPDDSYILENRFEALSGVDFRKGCYVGQEVTARMKHKTTLKKGLARVRLEGAAQTGAEIVTEAGKPAGRLGTVSGDQALAYLRFDRATGPLFAEGTALFAEGLPASE